MRRIMMKNSNFNRILNKFPFLQYIIGMLPVLLILLYSVVNLFSVMNIYATITNNDKQLAVSDVRHITTVEDNKYEYEALNSIEFKAPTNSSLFKIYALNTTTVSYETVSGEVLYVKNSPIVGNATFSEDKLQYEKGLIDFGEQVAEVFLLEDNTYEIKYSETTEKTDKIVGLTTIGKDAENFLFKLDDTGVISTDEIFFTTQLETDDFYADINNQVILRNTSANFFQTYIIENNMYIILAAAFFFLVLVLIAHKQKVLTELSKKVYVFLHIVTTVIALVTLFITILLLS